MTIPELSNNPLLQHLQGYIGGQFLTPTETPLEVLNPANGQLLARLPRYGTRETQQAIAHAKAALAAGPSLTQRREWLLQIADAHTQHRQALAAIVSLENGKPLAEALGEVDYSAGFYSAAAEQLDQLEPRPLKAPARGHSWTVHSRPAGVAGLIVPWNFPLAMLAKKASAALAAGVAMVVKPAEKTPLSCIALFHLLDQLRLPPGQVNLVFGDAPAIGRELCENPAVRVLSFTGSTAVGKHLAQLAAPHIKRLALELGGNAPFIVFEDADLQLAADQLMLNKFRCAGQTCVCSNRVYVHQTVSAEFTQLVAQRMTQLRMGPASDPSSQLGPLIDRAAFVKVQQWVSQALQSGAKALVGGLAKLPAAEDGWFYPPTLLVDTTHDADCLREEVFGPVVPLVSFCDEDEAVREANGTEHGLAAYVFTRDPNRAARVISQLSFGHVAWNSAIGPIPEAPFGGMKQSGLGREGGAEGMLEFVELQTVATPQ